MNSDGFDGRGFAVRSEEGQDGLETLADLAEQLVRLDAVVEERREALAQAEKSARILSEELIPKIVEELGMPIPPEGLKIPTRRGFSILVKEYVSASCAKDRMPALIAWLDANGESGMVKREIKLAFNRDQGEEAIALRDELRGRYPAVDANETVHALTLKAWVRRRLEAGEDVPDVVALNVARKATVV